MKKGFIILTTIVILFLVSACDKQLTSSVITTEAPVIVEITREEKILLDNTVDEFKMYTLTTNVPGPTIFIVGGTHGDEVAGYLAATELLNYDFKKGKIIIVPKLNTVAIEQNVRYSKQDGYQDLNRAFPGNEKGTKTELIAKALYDEIKKANPDYMFDMHESRNNWKVPPYLGDSLIAHTASGNDFVGFLGSDVVETYNANRNRNDSAFTLLNEPVKGSLNRTVSEDLLIPVFTIETNRKLELERRIIQQKQIASIILEKIWELPDDN